jgi:DNA topoisomerase-3
MFKPEPYWVLDLGIVKGGRISRATWEYGRSFNQSKVNTLARRGTEDLKEGHPAFVEVIGVVTKEKKQGRPTPLNTVAFLKACSKSLGIGPHAALSTAERLYLSGYLSYPRTESSAYPSSFDVKGTLQAQSDDPRWGQYVRELLKAGPNKAKGGHDAGDHPPITPCRGAGLHELSGDMARVFELVVRHFIATVSPDAVWMGTKVNLAVPPLGDKGNFSLMGKQLVR